mmetsp:Transcript_26723/g.63744  ORF Transcript_26723/g.63744 Transcript_26723/m.63744 type:complete len:89 (+) Transcript_26723:390-656(+)
MAAVLFIVVLGTPRLYAHAHTRTAERSKTNTVAWQERFTTKGTVVVCDSSLLYKRNPAPFRGQLRTTATNNNNNNNDDETVDLFLQKY